VDTMGSMPSCSSTGPRMVPPAMPAAPPSHSGSCRPFRGVRVAAAGRHSPSAAAAYAPPPPARPSHTQTQPPPFPSAQRQHQQVRTGATECAGAEAGEDAVERVDAHVVPVPLRRGEGCVCMLARGRGGEGAWRGMRDGEKGRRRKAERRGADGAYKTARGSGGPAGSLQPVLVKSAIWRQDACMWLCWGLGLHERAAAII
jgi:hypothetical protein